MKNVSLLMCAGIAIALAGCAPSPLDGPWQSPGHNQLAYHSPSVPEVGKTKQQQRQMTLVTDGPLTLKQALAAALVNNPKLASFAWGVRAAEARTLQASLWPNPRLELETEGIGLSSSSLGFGQTETTVRLTQPILTGDKIAKRTHVAQWGRELAAWDYQVARLDVLTEIVQRYIDVLAKQGKIQVAQQTRDLTKQVLVAVTRLVEAGEVSSLELKRSTVEFSEAEIALLKSQHKLDAAKAALAGAIGLKDVRFTKVTGKLGVELKPLPPLNTLLVQVKQNPDIARWEAKLAQGKAHVDLAKAKAVPDVAVSLGLQRFNEQDDYAGLIALELPLPIFDRNQGEILEKRFELSQAKSRKQAEIVRVRTDLREAYQQLKAARKTVLALRKTTLPAARQAYQGIRTAYRQGKLPLLDVLDAQRTLFAIESRFVEALAEYHRSAARIERLIGQSLNHLNQTTLKTTS